MYVTDLIVSESAENVIEPATPYDEFDLVIHGTLPSVTHLHPYKGNKQYSQQEDYDIQSGHLGGKYGSLEYEMEG